MITTDFKPLAWILSQIHAHVAPFSEEKWSKSWFETNNNRIFAPDKNQVY
jgi:hypothetical protein